MSSVASNVVRIDERRVSESIEEVIHRAENRARAQGIAYRGLLTPEEAWRVVQEAPGATLVDIRTAEELTLVGSVPEAVNIQWRLYDGWALNPRFLRDVKNRFVTTDLILLLCRSGVRSREAGEFLAEAGYRNCFNVLEGFEGDKNADGRRVVAGWKVRGLPWSH
ncbi:rhodanese-like domain-containing protein [uncultured Propionivibrio sp.]|uniref:rhodanese-like domain-containing protein n=1 Tax=uncultured Propionivibrio sp. TaxID=426737 RepID=UPI0029C0E2B0|nr:rhodanese-like domain-containing protein [uncultured Propionivibrio sp.]